jgi:hypothetical protein
VNRKADDNGTTLHGWHPNEIVLGGIAVALFVLAVTVSDLFFLPENAIVCILVLRWVRDFVYRRRGASMTDYLLVILVWVLATSVGYWALSQVSNQQFRIPMPGDGPSTDQLSFIDAFYFAITSAATVGYGDIAPVSQKARLISATNMIVSFTLLTGVLSWLISKFVSNEGEKK